MQNSLYLTWLFKKILMKNRPLGCPHLDLGTLGIFPPQIFHS